MEIKFTHNKQNVTASGKENWFITDDKGIRTFRATVVSLAPKLGGEIDAIVKSKFDRIEAEQLAKEKAVKAAFKKKVESIKADGINIEFTKDNEQTVNLWRETSKKQKVSGTISFHPTAWGSWSYHPTNKKWVLNFDYKNIRYASLENALTGAAKKINAKVQSKEDSYVWETERAQRDIKLATELDREHQLQLKNKVGRWSDYAIGKIIKEKKTKWGWTDKVEIWGKTYPDSKKKLDEYAITDIKITGKMTVKGMSLLAALLTDMANNGDIKMED